MLKNNLEAIQVFKNGSLPFYNGPSNYFTGSVIVNSLLPSGHLSDFSAASVTFEPGARTAWHTHPKGQLLIITAGLGQVQSWEGEISEVSQGDVVWFPPHVKHWHGAASNHSMTHIAILSMENGQAADFMEHVTD